MGDGLRAGSGMTEAQAAPRPILGLVIVCCLLSALCGVMLSSAFWEPAAEQRAENAIAAVCPTTTSLPEQTTTTAPTTAPPATAPPAPPTTAADPQQPAQA